MTEVTLIDMLRHDRQFGYRHERSQGRLAAAWRISRRLRCKKGPSGASFAVALSANPESIDQSRQASVGAKQGFRASVDA
ncbi:MAG: hypothetical protein KKC85_14620, partial [Gammaproteobacteria bacterium]|nr:hypothetical protein [Gammaproteobacteria bacterium]